MRPRFFACIATAVLAIAGPAFAAPVYVTPMVDNGTAPGEVSVVAFSYDVKKIFPAIEKRFEQWRPRPPVSGSRPIRQLPTIVTWHDYHLIQTMQLEEFRDAFRESHYDEKELLVQLMPRFDEVFKRYGERATVGSPSDVLSGEDTRQVWCKKVTNDLNAIIKAYNGLNGADDPANAAYRQQYARWLGQRSEALRVAASRAGGNPSVDFVESATNEAGLAVFDLPAGRWYFACQLDRFSWYKPVIVPPGGGRVVLRPQESIPDTIDLTNWIGN